MNLAPASLCLALAAFGFGTLAAPDPAPAPVGEEPFLGEIMWVPYNFDPRGWASCDGQLLEIRQHEALFSLLGATYGGDGRTTFALPDLRGRVSMHVGLGTGLSTRELGQRGGAESVTLSVEQMPVHAHGLRTSNTMNNQGRANALLSTSVDPTSAEADAVPRVITNSGGGQAHDNMPPFLGLRAVIALEGRFPGRN